MIVVVKKVRIKYEGWSNSYIEFTLNTFYFFYDHNVYTSKRIKIKKLRHGLIYKDRQACDCQASGVLRDERSFLGESKTKSI